MQRGAARSVGHVIARWTVLVVFAVLLAFPFYWMFITTFKQTADLYTLQNNPFKFNMAPTLEHLKLTIMTLSDKPFFQVTMGPPDSNKFLRLEFSQIAGSKQ